MNDTADLNEILNAYSAWIAAFNRWVDGNREAAQEQTEKYQQMVATVGKIHRRRLESA